MWFRLHRRGYICRLFKWKIHHSFYLVSKCFSFSFCLIINMEKRLSKNICFVDEINTVWIFNVSLGSHIKAYLICVSTLYLGLASSGWLFWCVFDSCGSLSQPINDGGQSAADCGSTLCCPWVAIMKRNGSTRGHTVLYSGNAGLWITVSGSEDLCGQIEHNTAATCAAFWPLACHHLW